MRLPLELRNSLKPPDAAELPRPDGLGREADTGMVGTEMLAPPDTDDWLLLENDEGKLEGEKMNECWQLQTAVQS